MGTHAPKINALVGLLNTYHPATLEELKRKHPAYAAQLEPGIRLGAVEISDAHVYVEVALHGLQTARERVEPNMRRLRHRLSRAKRLRLIGQIVAAMTSIGLLTALLAGWDQGVTVATAVVNFAAVVASLVAGHLEAPLYGGTGTLIDLFETLVTTNAEADQLIQDLLILQRTRPDEPRMMEQVMQANAVANKLRLAEHRLWGRAGA